MAVAILKAEKIESSEPIIEASNFLTTTIKNIFKKHESEIEYNNSLKQISLEEVKHHDCYEDCWIIIYDRVYDITKFLHHVSKTFNLLSNTNRALNIPEKEFKRVHNIFNVIHGFFLIKH